MFCDYIFIKHKYLVLNRVTHITHTGMLKSDISTIISQCENFKNAFFRLLS